MIFNRKITPNCEYCRFGSMLDADHVICIKRGIIDSGAACRKFRYDPLKRRPDVPRKYAPKDYDRGDFSL